jgi:quercetin dioxygenase-like cupin family protein
VGHYRYDVPGDQVTEYSSVKVRSVALASGKGETHVWLLTFEPHGMIGAHTAGFDQLFFVLEGSAWVVANGERTELAAHEAATIDLGQVHSKGSETGARVLMVQLSSLEEPRSIA